jgi:hypothetical protein
MATEEADVNDVRWGLAELGGDVDDLSKVPAMPLLTVVSGGS